LPWVIIDGSPAWQDGFPSTYFGPGIQSQVHTKFANDLFILDAWQYPGFSFRGYSVTAKFRGVQAVGPFQSGYVAPVNVQILDSSTKSQCLIVPSANLLQQVGHIFAFVWPPVPGNYSSTFSASESYVTGVAYALNVNNGSTSNPVAEQGLCQTDGFRGGPGGSYTLFGNYTSPSSISFSGV
jgi:hypothetical protein